MDDRLLSRCQRMSDILLFCLFGFFWCLMSWMCWKTMNTWKQHGGQWRCYSDMLWYILFKSLKKLRYWTWWRTTWAQTDWICGWDDKESQKLQMKKTKLHHLHYSRCWWSYRYHVSITANQSLFTNTWEYCRVFGPGRGWDWTLSHWRQKPDVCGCRSFFFVQCESCVSTNISTHLHWFDFTQTKKCCRKDNNCYCL